MKEGTYKPTTSTGSGGDRNKHFSLRNGVTVIGGFSGNEDGAIPDGNAARTILSGNLGDENISTDNVYHVFKHKSTSLGSTAILRNVTITGGYADGQDPEDRLGGGMFNNGCSPIIENCIFRDNFANDNGGGMYNEYSSDPEIKNCSFTDNDTSGTYNDIGNDFSSNPVIIND